MLHTKAILHRKDDEIRAHDCIVSKVVELSDSEFRHFQQNLMQDYEFIAENQDAMDMDSNGVSHCLLVMGEGHEDGVLVRSEGYDYARYSALLPHARSILAQQNMSPTLVEMNQKLMTFAEHAAMEADRQLSQSGRAELPLADMSHRFDLDLFDNKTMWDTASRMVAEHLDEWDLDFEVDKNMFVAVDYDIQNIIETCKNRIPFDPLVAPSDQEWGVRRVDSIDELLEKFEHGNWSVRTGFVLGDLAFIEQIGGGDEWLSLKHDGDTWHRFDSISFGHMIEQSDIDYCRGHLEYLAAAPANELLRQPDSARQQSIPDAIAPEMHEKLIEDIARRNCFVNSLAIQNRDSLDFHDVSVWGLKSALEEAYRVGMQAQAEQNLSPQQEVEPPEPTQEISPMMVGNCESHS